MESYVYRPLLPAPNSIRLVQILSGKEDSDIHCKILDYTIRPQQPVGLFEALSYVWGSPANPRRILVSEVGEDIHTEKVLCYLDVTQNLFAALQHLRDPALPRTMWIDAICINQNDLAERSEQVQLMATLYSHASRVVVWLGEDSDGSTKCLGHIENAVEDAQRYFLKSESSVTERLELQVTALLSRPWFGRIWILQEASAGRHLAIVCGKEELPGHTFCSGLRQLMVALEVPTELRNFVEPVIDLMVWQHSFTRRQSTPNSKAGDIRSFSILPLGHLLDTYHLHAASDRRDKVYALLGMHAKSEESFTLLKPDYTLPWADLLSNTIRYILGGYVTIRTIDSLECALISGLGHIMGVVRKVTPSDIRIDCVGYQDDFINSEVPKEDWTGTWKAPRCCKSIEEGDILCNLQGAASPSIIRFCQDHFDIIIISLPPPDVLNFRQACLYCKSNGSIKWVELLEYSRSYHRRLALVWDWSPVTSNEHRWILEKLATESLANRLLDSARVFDDLANLQEVQSIVARLQQEDIPNENCRQHMRLLHLVCAQWPSYLWFRDMVEHLTRCKWALESTRWCSDKSCQSMAFWKWRQGLDHDILSLHSFFNVDYNVAPTQQLKGKSIRDTFGEAENHAFLFMLFSQYTSQYETMEILPCNGRYLMTLFIKVTRSDFTCQQPLFENQLDLLVKDKTTKIALAMLSEGTGISPKIPCRSVRSIYDFGADIRLADTSVSAFVLAECAGDPEATYEAFKTILPRRIPQDHESYNEIHIAWCELCADHPSLIVNLLEDGGLVAAAARHEDDMVLPWLHREVCSQCHFAKGEWDSRPRCDHEDHSRCKDPDRLLRDFRWLVSYEKKRGKLSYHLR